MLKLKQVREAKGFSQDELAEKMGVTQTIISQWENGGNPTIQNLAKAAQVLEVGMEELLKTQTKPIVPPLERLINLIKAAKETVISDDVQVLSFGERGIILYSGIQKVAEEYQAEITVEPYESQDDGKWNIRHITVNGMEIRQYDPEGEVK